VVKIDKEVVNLPKYCIFTRTMLPSLVRCFQLQVREIAQVKAARTAMAIEQYRLDKNSFPEKLDQLVPDYLESVPIDPFDNKPLRYRVDKDAVVVYSIGEDGVDDGGDVKHRTTKQQAGDWGFVLLKPAYRNLPPEKKTSTTQPTQPARRIEIFSTSQ